MFNPLFSIPVAMIALTQQLPTQIHVKIFPHLYNYEPMGKDSDATQVTLKSAGQCKIFAGNPRDCELLGCAEIDGSVTQYDADGEIAGRAALVRMRERMPRSSAKVRNRISPIPEASTRVR